MMYKAMHGLAPAMDSYNTSIWTESAGCRRCTGVGYYFQPLQQCSSVHYAHLYFHLMCISSAGVAYGPMYVKPINGGWLW